MTKDSRHHEDSPSAADLVRSAALSSAELWYEILERLRDVQESQARLAAAIESLGFMVRDALLPGSAAALGAPPEVGERPRLGAGVPASAFERPPVGGVGTLDGPGRVPGPADSDPVTSALLGFKAPPAPAEDFITSVETSAPMQGSGAAEVTEPLFATEVPEPIFYVPPFEEEVLPATSVAELTPTALDAVLAAEFGSPHPPAHTAGPPPAPGSAAPPAPTVQVTAQTTAQAAVQAMAQAAAPMVTAAPDALRSEPTVATQDASPADRRRSAVAVDPDEVLDILLGTRRSDAAPADVHPTASADVHVATHTFDLPAGASGAPGAPAIEPSFRFEPATPVVPVAALPAPELTFAAPPPPPPPPPISTLPPPPPMSTLPPPPAPSPFSLDALLPPAPIPARPAFSVNGGHAPAPAAVPVPLVFGHASDPGVVPAFVTAPEPGEVSGLYMATPPPPPAQVPSPAQAPPPLPQVAAVEADVAEPLAEPFAEPFAEPLAVEPLFAEPEPLTPFVYSADEGATEVPADGLAASVASMATEILSATPEIPTVAVPDARESELISKDLTLIARGRKKRFRLR